MAELDVSLDDVLVKALSNSGGSSPQDSIVIALHSSLLSTGFVCVALGDEGFGGVTTRQCEAISTSEHPQLPLGWNRSSDIFALQYRHERTQQMCLVKVIPLGVQLIISALVASQMDKVFSLTLMPSKYVRDVSSYNSVSIYRNLLQLVSILNKEIGGELFRICDQTTPGHPVTTEPDTTNPLGHGRRNHFPEGPDHVNDPLRIRPSRSDPLDPSRMGPPGRPDHITDPLDPLRIGLPRRPIGDPDPRGNFGPFGYGDRDRLPFGGSGGMIFDPLRQGSRGRGGGGMPGFGPHGPYPPGHPPGARYDPIGPFGPSRPRPPPPGRGGGFYGPSPDHLPPPGYDDMFS